MPNSIRLALLVDSEECALILFLQYTRMHTYMYMYVYVHVLYVHVIHNTACVYMYVHIYFST